MKEREGRRRGEGGRENRELYDGRGRIGEVFRKDMKARKEGAECSNFRKQIDQVFMHHPGNRRKDLRTCIQPCIHPLP